MSDTTNVIDIRGTLPRYSPQERFAYVDDLYRPLFRQCRTANEHRALVADHTEALRSVGVSPTDPAFLQSVRDLHRSPYFRASSDSTWNDVIWKLNWCGILALFLWTFVAPPPGPVGPNWYNVVYYTAIIAAISGAWRSWTNWLSLGHVRSGNIKSKVYVDAAFKRTLTDLPLAVLAFALEVCLVVVCAANAYYAQATLFLFIAVFSGLSLNARRDHHKRIGP